MMSVVYTARSHLSHYLEDLDKMPGQILNGVIAALVLLSSLIFVAETYPLPPSVGGVLRAVNIGILVIFSVEYLLRLWCADEKLQYVFSPYSLIDLVAIVPFFLGAIDISFVLILRWVRILKLLRFIQGHTIIGYISSEDSVILTRILFSLFAIVFVYSGLIYQVEHPNNGAEFHTFLDALYFAVATMTTVGFGDITPRSEVGRFLTILMIWTGIVVIPWQVGDLIKHVVRGMKQVKAPCPACGTEFHSGDAEFCRRCGTSLQKTNGVTDSPEPQALSTDIPSRLP
ncbi:MAG: ion transporter [Elainellaceae cyanobacterium]